MNKLIFDPTQTTPAPWHVERNQIKNAKNEALGSYPYNLGGTEDHQNGLLMAKAPELLDAIALTVLLTSDLIEFGNLKPSTRAALKALNELLEKVIK